MNWISTQFSRHGRYINVTAVLIFSILFIFGPSIITETIDRTILAGLYYPFYKIENFFKLMVSQVEANDQLRESLMILSLQLSEYEEIQRENIRLRDALGFTPPSGYHLLPAEVISVSGYKMSMSAIINQGINDSVFNDDPVINQDGLVGRISSTTSEYATVQLLTDPSNRVAARVASSREMGIVKYKVLIGMILDNFPLHGTITVGDTVISSGLGGIYPPGLILGYVTEINRDESETFCMVKLTPAVNFHSIDEVFVLKAKGEM